MKANIATDSSQSDRLLRCGVSADTADMCYDSGALSLMDYDSAVWKSRFRFTPVGGKKLTPSSK